MQDYPKLTNDLNLNSIQKLYDYYKSEGWKNWVYEYQNESLVPIGDISCQNYWGFQFVFDFTEDLNTQEYEFTNLPESRVIVAFGVSSEKANAQHRKRMSNYLGNSSNIYAHFGPGYTKGHFIANRMGGAIDINLYPQIGHINMGRSVEGKKYVAMERYVAQNPGTFVFCRPIYKDFSVRPFQIEYGYCDSSMNWKVETFTNLALEA